MFDLTSVRADYMRLWSSFILLHVNACWNVFVFQSFGFLISSDYERAEWKEIIKEQQKKCECPPVTCTLIQHVEGLKSNFPLL